jgi:hypothetical protein
MMDEIEQRLREIPERMRLAGQIEEPVRSFLMWLVDQEAHKLQVLQEARAAA